MFVAVRLAGRVDILALRRACYAETLFARKKLLEYPMKKSLSFVSMERMRYICFQQTKSKFRL